MNDSSVKFSDDLRWNSGKMAVQLSAVFSGKEILCLVSEEALADLSRGHIGSGDQALSAFRQHAEKIHGVAEALIRAGRFEQDGSVIVRTGDVGG
ncbi:DUF1488 domain-containing protein [Pelagibius litoralis]|uniref:DUF1488 domain-containing protein n=1 Tax=Pelagibius litoralis TaxID=374515 RepID=A0A967F3K8_9PROT|nr:DUF1488 domain-containing protein [Pelagibius litoralis]NIA72364.1 DUF1488 domain-containing protein [Pelagibius litoralis]